MSGRVSVDHLADAIAECLEEYADLTTEDLKKAVRKAGKTVKEEIQTHAPKDTGDYAKSWTVKATKETPRSLVMTVYSKNRYRLTHLLEWGHAKRDGGRVAGKEHIGPAAEKGEKDLMTDIERNLRNE